VVDGPGTRPLPTDRPQSGRRGPRAVRRA
jgi:hypothetical protein